MNTNRLPKVRLPNNGLQADSGFAAPQLARLANNRSGLPASLTRPAAEAGR